MRKGHNKDVYTNITDCERVKTQRSEATQSLKIIQFSYSKCSLSFFNVVYLSMTVSFLSLSCFHCNNFIPQFAIRVICHFCNPPSIYGQRKQSEECFATRQMFQN